MQQFNQIKTAFINTTPIFTGYLVLGIGMGLLLVVKGFNPLLAPFMAVTMYAGAMQYLAVDLLAAQLPLTTIALATLLVNARHLFYGISLIEKYQKTGWRKIYLAFGLTDETYSLIAGDNTYREKSYYFWVTILDHIYWIAGCSLGALAGTLLPSIPPGIDFALTALFIAIFTEQWLCNTNHTNALIGLYAAGICLLIFGKNNFLIPTMLLIGSGLMALKHLEDRYR